MGRGTAEEQRAARLAKKATRGAGGEPQPSNNADDPPPKKKIHKAGKAAKEQKRRRAVPRDSDGNAPERAHIDHLSQELSNSSNHVSNKSEGRIHESGRWFKTCHKVGVGCHLFFELQQTIITGKVKVGKHAKKKNTASEYASAKRKREAEQGQLNNRSAEDMEHLSRRAKPVQSSFKYTCFIGQLSFDTDADMLKAELRNYGVEQAGVRLLTDKTTGRFKGFGFVDVKTEAERKKVLKLHHTIFNGRRINVERVQFQQKAKDAIENGEQGGPNDHKRKGRQMWSKKLESEEVERLVKNQVLASGGALRREDFDDKNLSFLGLMERPVVEEVLRVASKKAKNINVRNRQAYIMGVIIRVSKKARDKLRGGEGSTRPVSSTCKEEQNENDDDGE